MDAVFTYGSLMYSSVWRSVVRGRYTSRYVTVRGFKRFAVVGEHYPGLVASTDMSDCVEGRLYSGVVPSDLERLDRFEGAQYVRRKILIDGISADVYLWRRSLSCRLSVDAWDQTLFERTGLPLFLRRYGGFK